MVNLSWRKISLLSAKFFVKYFKIILILNVLIIFGLGYYWFLRPELIKTKQEVDLAEIENYAQYLADYLLKLQSLQTAQRQLTAETLDKLSKILPNDQDIAGLFVQFQTIAEENGFILEAIDISQPKTETAAAGPQMAEEEFSDDQQVPLISGPMPASASTPTPASTIKKLEISLTVSGNGYSALKNLLSAIEFNLRLFDISELTFDDIETGPYTIGLRTYYLPKLN